MRPERLAKFRRVALQRQFDLTVILENVHDQHNIGAVLRSCDAVGIREIYVLHSEPNLKLKNLALGKRTSAGARRWVDVHFYREVEACFDRVKARYQSIYATHLSEDAVSLHSLDLSRSVALLFGNERDGLSREVLAHANANFHIPMMGMAESLNISVACAVTLFEAQRQRTEKNYYGDDNPTPLAEREALLGEFVRRHEEGVRPRRSKLSRE